MTLVRSSRSLFTFARVVGVSLVTTFATTTAFAQGPDPSSAEALFRTARDAMARGDLETACARFAESQRLDPAPGTLLNLAQCEEKQGKLATSFAHVTEALEGLPKNDFRLTYARQQRAALEPRLPKLVITVSGEGASGAHVLRDGVELRTASLGVALPVDPGKHELVLHVDGRADTRQEVSIREGQSLAVELKPGAIEVKAVGAVASTSILPSPATATTEPVRDRDEEEARPKRIMAITSFAVGGIGIATGIVTGLMFADAASTYKEHCDSTGCDPEGMSAADRAKTLDNVSPVAFGVGVLGIGAGTYFLLSSKRAVRKAGAIDVHPSWSPAMSGLTLSGGF